VIFEMRPQERVKFIDEPADPEKRAWSARSESGLRNEARRSSAGACHGRDGTNRPFAAALAMLQSTPPGTMEIVGISRRKGIVPTDAPVLSVVVVTLAVAACTQAPSQGAASPSATSSATPAAHATPGSVASSTNASGEPTLTIDPADATCGSNEDCRMTMTRCSCDCGSPVNVAHMQKYVDAQDRMCKGFNGVMCKMACHDTPTCVGGVCRMKP